MTPCSGPLASAITSGAPTGRFRLASAVAVSVLVHITLATSLTGGSARVSSPSRAQALSARLAYVPAPVLASVPEARPLGDEPIYAPAPERHALRSRTKTAPDTSPAAPAHSAAGTAADLPDATYYPAKQLDVYPTLTAPLDLRAGVSRDAAAAGGRALLLLLIDETGVVHDVTLVEAEPAGYGAEDAKRAFVSARFTPAYRNGRAVKSRVLVEITYGKDRAE